MIETAPVPAEATKEVSTAVEQKMSYESFKARGSHDVEEDEKKPELNETAESPVTEPTVEANTIEKREAAVAADAPNSQFNNLTDRMGGAITTMLPEDALLEDCESMPRVGFGFCGAIQPFDSIFKVLCFSSDESREPVETELIQVPTKDSSVREELEARLGLDILKGVSFEQMAEDAKARAMDNLGKIAKATQMSAESTLESEKQKEAREAKAKAEAEAEALKVAEEKKKVEDAEEKKRVKAEAKAKAKAHAKARAKAEAKLKIKAKAEAKAKADAAAKAKSEAKSRAIAEAKAANKAKAKAESAARAAAKAKARADTEAKVAVKARAKAEAKAEALVKAEAAIIALEEDRKKEIVKEDESMKRINKILADNYDPDDDSDVEEEEEATEKADEEDEKAIQDATSRDDAYAEMAVAASLSQGDDMSFSDVAKLNEIAKSILSKSGVGEEKAQVKAKADAVKPVKSTDTEDLKKMNQRATSIIRGVWKNQGKKGKHHQQEEQALE